MKKILFVEDKREERKKIRILELGSDYYIHIVSDLDSAILFLVDDTEIKWDGVVTDVFLPKIIGADKPEPRGIEIMVICSQKKIPFVVCTDTDGHHGHWIKSIAKRLGAKGFITNKGEAEGAVAWEEAVKAIG